MKKAYEKPQMIFDSFELSQSIAAGCEGIANYNKDECSVSVPYGQGTIDVFISTEICLYVPPEGHEDDMVCYHVPDDYRNVFSS